MKYKITDEADALNFIHTLAANISNEGLSDSEFRQFVKNTLPLFIEENDREGMRNERKSETHMGSKVIKYLLAMAVIMSLGGFLTTHHQYKSIKSAQAVKMDINERLPDGWLYNLNHSIGSK